MAGGAGEYGLASRIPMAIFLILVIIVGLIGNGLICMSIYRNRELKKTLNNWFILNMSFADIGVLVFCVYFPLSTYIKGHWDFSNTACQLSGFLNSELMLASILTLTMISLHQYFTVVSKWSQAKLRRSAIVMLVYVWTHSTILSLLPLTSITSYDIKTGRGQCSVKIPEKPGEKLTATFYIVTGFFVPLLIMSFSYYRIMKKVAKHNRRVSRLSQNPSMDRKMMQRHVAITMIIVLIMFLICWTPFLIMSLLGAYVPALSTPGLGNFGFLLGFANSCCNPIVLGTRNKSFKYEYIDMFNNFKHVVYQSFCKEQQKTAAEELDDHVEAADLSVVHSTTFTSQAGSKMSMI